MSVFSKAKAALNSGLSEQEQATVNEVKELILSEYGHTPSQTDPALWDLIKEHLPEEGADEETIGLSLSKAMEAILDDDPTYEGQEESEDEVEALKNASKPLSARKGDEKAIELADTISEDKAIIAELTEFVTVENKRKRAPAALGFLFLKRLGENMLLSCPVPGSRYDDTDEDGKLLYGPKGRYPNRAFDIRKTDKNGGGSFCQDIANQIPMGREHIVALDDVRAASGKNKEVQTSGKYKGWTQTQLDEEEAWHKSQLTQLKNGVKAGLSAAIKIVQVGKQTKLSARFRTTGKGDSETVMARHAVVEVYYLKKVMDEGKEVNEKVSRWVNASTLLRVNLDEVAAKADPQDQLEAFIAKKGKSEGTDDERFIAITNADEVSDVFFEINARKGDKGFLASISRKVQSKDGGEFLDQLAGIEEFCRRFTRTEEAKRKIAEYRATQEEADKKDKKAA